MHAPRSAFRAAAATLLCCAALISGCSEPPDSPAVIKARSLLQRNESQAALDALEGDASAEGHYLKSVALERLKLHETASHEIAAALELRPDNAKYQSFQARLELVQGDRKSGQKMIATYLEHPTSAMAALCAFYGYELERVRNLASKQAEETTNNGKEARKALATSARLCAEIPEFQRELLELTLRTGLPEEAESIAAKLLAVDPSDQQLIQKRLTALLLSKKSDQAFEIARENYVAQDRSERGAAMYSAVFTTLGANTTRDSQIEELCKRYPRNTDVQANTAIYYAKSDRLELAETRLSDAISQQNETAARQKLIQIAIDMPLELGNAQVAERTFEAHRAQIDDPLLLQYFEARLLHLQGKQAESLEKLTALIGALKAHGARGTPLSRETLLWMRKLIVGQTDQQKLSGAMKALDQLQETLDPQGAAESNTAPVQPAATEENPNEAKP